MSGNTEAAPRDQARNETWVDKFERLVERFSGLPDGELVRIADVLDGPLRISYEPHEHMAQPRTSNGRFTGAHARIAIKSGCYTLFTVGDYWDGGLDGFAARLLLLCRAFNERELS